MCGYGDSYGCRITNYYYDPEPYLLFAYISFYYKYISLLFL